MYHTRRACRMFPVYGGAGLDRPTCLPRPGVDMLPDSACPPSWTTSNGRRRYRECKRLDRPALSDVATYYRRFRKRLVRSSPCAPSLPQHTVGREPSQRYRRPGGLVELVHLGSLYHDDVIDEAETRRSGSSVNARWSTRGFLQHFSRGRRSWRLRSPIGIVGHRSASCAVAGARAPVLFDADLEEDYFRRSRARPRRCLRRRAASAHGAGVSDPTLDGLRLVVTSGACASRYRRRRGPTSCSTDDARRRVCSRASTRCPPSTWCAKPTSCSAPPRRSARPRAARPRCLGPGCRRQLHRGRGGARRGDHAVKASDAADGADELDPDVCRTLGRLSTDSYQHAEPNVDRTFLFDWSRN